MTAFLSSVCASIGTTRSLLPNELSEEANVFFDRGCEEWKQKLGVSELPHNQIFQSEWDTPICKQKFQNLINNAPDEEERARLLAISSEGASAWLNAIPLSSLGLKLSDTELPIVCSLRLGSTLCQPHECKCGQDVESDGRLKIVKITFEDLF